jgi:hypothetical protein
MGLFNLPPIDGTLIIGFGHKARQGKDIAVQRLVESYPNLCKRFAFGDDLKALCRVKHGMTRKDPGLLQRVGHGLRQEDAEVWERSLYWNIVEHRPQIALISDVRYKQEANFIKHLGGFLVRVDRIGPNGNQVIAADRDPKHPSEVDLDGYQDWDKIIRGLDGYPVSTELQADQALRDICEDANVELPW